VNRPIDRDELLAVMGDFCNGTLDASAGRTLEAALRSDPQARQLFLNYMAVHANLYAEGGLLMDPAAHDSLGPRDVAGTETMLEGEWDEAGLQHVGPSPKFASQQAAHRSWMGLALAASVALVAVGSSWVTYLVLVGQGRSQSLAADAGAVEPSELSPSRAFVARITGTHNCVWSQRDQGLAYGSHLAAGQSLALLDGLAEITFADGATVLLEGPAEFVADASDRVALENGRLAAIVPRRARGFRVHTASLDVFEVGTEFGLLAQASGATELHVFNGVVKANVLGSGGETVRQLELNSSQAARINPLSTTVLEFPADNDQFVRSMIPSSGPHDGLLAYEGFRYPSGPLSAQNGGFGWAGPWFSISEDDESGGDSNRVLAGSLAVEQVVPTGNRAGLTGQYNRIRRSLATSVGGVFDAAGLVENQDGMRLVGRDGNVVYLSFLQRVSAIGDGFYGVELHRGDGNANRVLCVGNGADGAGYGVTSNVNVFGKHNLPALGDETSDANFFVIRIEFGVADRDVVQVYRNPASLRDEQLCRPTAELKGNFSFDRISLANFDGEKIHEVDEIRVGTHFLAVTGRWGGNQGRMLRRVAAYPIDGDRESMCRATWPGPWAVLACQVGWK
jgi:hypothetical protein